MNNPFLDALGICKRAGKLCFGFETTKTAMQKGQVEIVFLASDLSLKSKKEMHFLCEQLEVEIIETKFDMQTLGGSISKKTGIIAVLDCGLAQMTKKKFVLFGEEQNDSKI